MMDSLWMTLDFFGANKPYQDLVGPILSKYKKASFLWRMGVVRFSCRDCTGSFFKYMKKKPVPFYFLPSSGHIALPSP
jgi:hypothetical protein